MMYILIWNAWYMHGPGYTDQKDETSEPQRMTVALNGDDCRLYGGHDGCGSGVGGATDDGSDDDAVGKDIVMMSQLATRQT